MGEGRKEERYGSHLHGCSSLRRGGASTRSPLSLPVTGAQDATKVKMETIHHLSTSTGTFSEGLLTGRSLLGNLS